MNEDVARMTVVKVAMSYHGGFYKWGGDDPSGFDCSGLAVECLKSIGLVGRKKDATAAGLFEHWNQGVYLSFDDDGQALHASFWPVPRGGDLVFWKNSNGKIIHVEIVINDELSIGASGGGSRTLTVADAIAQNAFIKIRPFRSRGGLAGLINPYGLNPL